MAVLVVSMLPFHVYTDIEAGTKIVWVQAFSLEECVINES